MPRPAGQGVGGIAGPRPWEDSDSVMSRPPTSCARRPSQGLLTAGFHITSGALSAVRLGGPSLASLSASFPSVGMEILPLVLRRGPRSVAPLGSILRPGWPLSGAPPQARVFWQWDNFHERQAAEQGKTLVRLNMDETSVCLAQTPARGLILRSVLHRVSARPRLAASLGQQRTYLSYVAFATDDAELQAVLPHFVLGNVKAFPARTFRTLFHRSPDHVFLLRGRTAWLNHEQLIRILEVVARVCRAHRPDALLQLSWDMAYAHLNVDVLRAAARLGSEVLLIPAKCTWLL